MNSQQLDPSLMLFFYDPEEGMILIQRNDDVSIDNTSATISGTLSKSGYYLVFANAFEPGAIGNYRLKASVH